MERASHHYWLTIHYRRHQSISKILSCLRMLPPKAHYQVIARVVHTFLESLGNRQGMPMILQVMHIGVSCWVNTVAHSLKLLRGVPEAVIRQERRGVRFVTLLCTAEWQSHWQCLAEILKEARTSDV
jgi:hypothetical protein